MNWANIYSLASATSAGLMASPDWSKLNAVQTPGNVFRADAFGVPSWGALPAADWSTLLNKPTNLVHTDLAETISGAKTFTAATTTFQGINATSGTFSGNLLLGGSNGNSYFDSSGDLHGRTGLSIYGYDGYGLTARFRPDSSSIDSSTLTLGGSLVLYGGGIVGSNGSGLNTAPVVIGASTTVKSGNVIDVALPTYFRSTVEFGGSISAAGGTFNGAIVANASGLKASLQGYPNVSSQFAGLWFGSATPTGQNYSFLSDGGTSFFNATAGNPLKFRIDNTDQFTVSSSGSTFYTPLALGGSNGNSYFDSSGGLHDRNGSFAIYNQYGNAGIQFNAGLPFFPQGLTSPQLNSSLIKGNYNGPLRIWIDTGGGLPFGGGNPQPIVIGDDTAMRSGGVIDMALPTYFRSTVDSISGYSVNGQAGIDKTITFYNVNDGVNYAFVYKKGLLVSANPA